MDICVRPMRKDEIGMVIDYFHGASAEHLEIMGVDPTRLPPPDVWRKRLECDLETPPQDCTRLLVTWLVDAQPIGFSTATDITYGDHAHMHLHIVAPDDRDKRIGITCVRQSVDVYFETLKLKRLFSEPNAFNVAPNRTLQRAGFRYVKTHMTVPGAINYHQAVTRWVFEPNVNHGL